MSAFAMKPTFSDQAGYRRWKQQWRALYHQISATIRRDKVNAKNAQRRGEGKSQQRQLNYQQAMAFKLMGLLQEARARWQRIITMQQQIAEQMASFPLTISDCRVVDFHFNRGSNEMPFLPKWVIKTKGKSYYIHHITAQCAWTTREIPEGSTKGMLRFRNCDLYISAEGEATITTSVAKEEAKVA